MILTIEAGNIQDFPISENERLNKLINVFNSYSAKNAEKNKYYEGKVSLNDVNLGIALPDNLGSLEIGCSWGAKTVDVLAARSMFDGFVGENGTLVVNRDGWEVIPENVSGNKRMEAVELHKPYGGGGLELHVKNHLECIKARTPEKCHASIQIGAHIAKFAHLGNIAYRTGKKLTWDGTSFHDREADKYLCKEYHNKWKFPKV